MHFLSFFIFLWTIMWTILKSLICAMLFLFLILVLFWPWSMWDLSSQPRVPNSNPCTGKVKSCFRWTASKAPVCIFQRLFSLNHLLNYTFCSIVYRDMVPFCWSLSLSSCLFNKCYHVQSSLWASEVFLLVIIFHFVRDSASGVLMLLVAFLRI